MPARLGSAIAAVVRATAARRLTSSTTCRKEKYRSTIRSGSMHHTLFLETDVRYRADVRDFGGEPIVLLWASFEDGHPDAVRDVLRLDTADGAIARLRWYYFCPEVLLEVGAALGVPVRTS